MADSRKYYYMRLKEDFFDSEKMIVLESIPDGIIYQNILLKMYCRSLKNDGRLMFNGIIPYNPQMLASITRQQVGTVEKALDVLQKLGLIEVLDNGAIYMLDIQNYIGASSTEADRQREYYNAITAEKDECKNSCKKSYKKPTQISAEISTRDRDIERDRDKTITKDKDTLGKNAEEIASLFNEKCPSLQKVIKINDKRKKKIDKLIKAYSREEIQTVFEKAEKSDFLSGKVKDFKACFDWLIEQSNFIKVLEGNYDNRQETQHSEINEGIKDRYEKYRKLGRPVPSYNAEEIELESYEMYKE